MFSIMLWLIKMANKNYNFIDLFAGAGGLSLGLEQAGFTPIFVNEIVAQYNETYRRNRNLSDDQYYVGDIKSLNENIGQYITRFKDVELVCGGPPCQGFSMANRQRMIEDPRNKLYKEYLKLLSVVRPKFFIMENVRGMSKKWDEIKENFEIYLNDGKDVKYLFSSHLMYAEDFGVPQHRERFIVIGNRLGINPESVFEEIFKYKRTSFVLKDALEGLPALGQKKEKGKNGEEDSNSGYTMCNFSFPKTEFFKFINGDKDVTVLYNHKNRYNNDRDVEIYRRLPQGGNSLHESIADIMPYKSRNNIFKDKYFKLEEGKICKTITSHMKFDCNMYIHPWYSRGLSPREAARLQTFPDDYVFYGPQNSWYAQIGNAVPVKLAEAIGKGIVQFL